MSVSDEPIVFDEPFFQGESQALAHLAKEELHNTYVRALVAGGQLVVSRDGLQAARLCPKGSDTMRVLIGSRPVPALFRASSRQPNGMGPKLLSLADGQATVFGTLTNGQRGVYQLTKTGVRLVTRADVLLGASYTPSGVIVFVRNKLDWASFVRVCAPPLLSHLMVHHRATVSLLGKKLIVLEPMESLADTNDLYRYVVSRRDGFQDLHPVPLESGEKVIGLVRWHGMYLLGTHGPSGSKLQGLGVGSENFRILPIHGQLEHLWQSPTGRAYAYVSRVERAGRTIRRFVVNGRMVYQGEFTVGAFDLVWSPDGRKAAIRLQSGNAPRGEMLVSSGSRIPIRAERHVEEFCVNNHGRIAAWIETDGQFSYPVIRGVPHDGVTYAWNLTAGEQTVRYNCVSSATVMAIRDHTIPST